jgi:ubiquinone biosynthesis monooxygenase Coq7
MKTSRNYSFVDQLCLGVDQALRAVFGHSETTGRQNPASGSVEPDLNLQQRKQSAGLMRVNHTGEVCAQALYHAQGLISRRSDIKTQMQQAAIEEGDHLAWCSTRLSELGSHTSYLNPVWYAGSFALGLTAGLIGDKWNLGFLAETENQVVQHLEEHLKLLPKDDAKSHKIVMQMTIDEAHHRDEANRAGAASLPDYIKKMMQFSSKIMVRVAYWV